MCGIIFAINTDNYATNLDDWIRDSLLASQVRGTHSAGLFQVSNKELTYVKDGVSPTDFIALPEAKKMIQYAPWADITVGHVRAATVGDVSQKNAHPFVAERSDGTYVAVVHNGTLTNWRGHPDANNYDVDSAWLAHMLATEGHDAFEYFQGAFAIVWYDSAHPGHLFMARNKERPLHYMVTNDGKTLIGCSELGMLGWLSEKHGFTIDATSHHDSPYYLEDGKIYKFSVDSPGEATVVEYPKYVPVVYNKPSYNNYPATIPYQAPNYGQSQYYDNDDIPWGMDGWHNSLSNIRETMDYEEQEELLDGVKKALRSARNVPPPATLDTAVLDASLGEVDIDAPPNEGAKPTYIDCGAVTLSTVNDGSVTKAERDRAKGLKVFGMVVRFSGIIHDPATSTMIGNFSMYEKGLWREYDAEMRFITSTVAKKYLEEDDEGNTKGYLAAVCGVMPDAVDGMVIVAPLSADQLEFIKDYEDAMENPLNAKVM